MKPIGISITLLALIMAGGLSPDRFAQAQPARGAAPAIERVREDMLARFRDLKLSGDPDRDFSELLIAFYEQQVFLGKAELEYGGDRQLREIAQRLQNEQEARLDEIKQWRTRSQSAGYRAQPDQPPPGSGPLDRMASEGKVAQSAAAAAPAKPAPATAPSTPLVSATVDDVNASAGKITLDHGAIPNLGMDAMTMVFRAADPAMLKTVKKGEKVQFSADRVNGQLTVTKIQKAR